MLGIVIPAHNEEAHLEKCLRKAVQASRHPGLAGEAVEIVVVLDSCTDSTSSIALPEGCSTLAIEARNVGLARALGAQELIARGARWLAFTDADREVSPSWLVDQLSLEADAVCGTVGVDDWTPHGVHASLLQWHFSQTYSDRENHRHVHGANLGVSAEAYLMAGGFQHLLCGEDHALVRVLEEVGARIAWSAKPRVVTSARKNARAAGGFADALIHAVSERLAGIPLPAPDTTS